MDMFEESQDYNPRESSESREKVTREALITFATKTEAGDPSLQEMLLQWMEDTRLAESSIQDIETSIMHTAMKYRLGFLSKNEALTELDQLGGALASEVGDTTDLHNRLSQLMYGIEDDTFDVIHRAK